MPQTTQWYSERVPDTQPSTHPFDSDVPVRLTATCRKGDMNLCPSNENTTVTPVPARPLKHSDMAKRVAGVITRKAKVARMTDAAYFRQNEWQSTRITRAEVRNDAAKAKAPS